MVHYKLTYFDCRALGECARLLFHYADVSFEDDVVPEDHTWPEKKPSFPYGKLPVLYIDGQPLAESNAINRYLAKQFGLAGKDHWETAQLDSIGDFYKDVYAELMPYLYKKLGYMEGDYTLLTDSFVASTEKLFPVYVKLLNESGSGFFAKSGVTWVDFLVANYLLNIRMHEPEILKKYPELEEHVDRVHSLPKVKEYVEKRPNWKF
uniref:glutathione transferase n=1 Tax=Acrobeloides nanus TaxID=290746 RepID=A0A914ECI8_9BILA